MTTDEELETIKEWLKRKQVTLWSVFDVSDDEGRTKAAKWFSHELDDIVQFAEGGGA